MKTLILTTALLAVALSGCSARPNSIAASSVPVYKYVNQSCGSLNKSLTSENLKLAQLSKVQNEKATGDAIGVFLIGIPMGSLNGDNTGAIAESKGSIISINAVRSRKNCK